MIKIYKKKKKKRNFVALCTKFNTYSDPVTWTDCFPFCYELAYVDEDVEVKHTLVL